MGFGIDVSIGNVHVHVCTYICWCENVGFCVLEVWYCFEEFHDFYFCLQRVPLSPALLPFTDAFRLLGGTFFFLFFSVVW